MTTTPTPTTTPDDSSARFGLLELDSGPRVAAVESADADTRGALELDLDGPPVADPATTSTPEPVIAEGSNANPIGVDLAPAARDLTVYTTGGELAADLPPALVAGIREARLRAANGGTVTEAQRARIAREAAERQAQAEVDQAITVALGDEAGEYRNGCLVAWRWPEAKEGDNVVREMPWRVLSSAFEAVQAVTPELAGVAGPAKRSDRAVAAGADRALEGRAFKVTTLKRGSSWSVYRPATTAAVGGSVGDHELIATLVGEDLTLDGPAELCAIVRDVWEAARQAAMVGTTEITLWLGGVLRWWRGVTVPYGRWLPPGQPTKGWRALAVALADLGLPIPRRPAGVAAREDVREELGRGLCDEVDALITDIRRDRDKAIAKSTPDKPRDIGARGAASAIGKIANVRAKLGLYECLVGPLPEARAQLASLEAELSPLADDATLRAMALDLDGGPTHPAVAA